MKCTTQLFKQMASLSWILVFCLLTSTNYSMAQELAYSLDTTNARQNIGKNASSYKLKNVVSLEKGTYTLKQALETIAEQADLLLSYSEQQVPLEAKLTINHFTGTTEEALWKALDGTGLRFGLSESGQLFLFKDEAVSAKKSVPRAEMISGTVLEADSDFPLPGVNVVVKGTQIGTATNMDGFFEFSVPSLQDTLIFSFLGFETLEVPINGRKVINVNLQPQAILGDELVVVGYGEQRKEAVTGSVVNIDGDALRKVASPNITQSLQGRLPGVEFSQTSSKPGESMQIRIRGVRSLNASNDPLVVLNGIPFTGSISDLNPADIESVNILKDASATAIYGSRGANGVILVSTKTGRRNQPATVSYNSFVGAKTVFSPYPMMSGPELERMREIAGQFQNGADEVSGTNTDWQDLFYRTGIMTNHDIGVSGGTEQGTYNVGLGYMLDQAVVPTQQYERISLRAAVDQQVGDYFHVGMNSNNNYSLSQGNQVGIYNILAMSPLADPYNDDGTFDRVIEMPLDNYWNLTRESIKDYEDLWLSESRNYATYNAMFAEVSNPWIEGLKYRMNLGLDYRQSNGGSFTGTGVNSDNSENPNSASVSNSHVFHWIIENLVTFDRTFEDKHKVNFTGLYSAEENKYYRSSMSAREIPNEAFQFYNLGAADGEITVSPNGQDYQLWGLKSWMGRAMYTYDNKYMITATIRSDGSSRLADGEKWHTYPAVSAGWNVNRESFMQDQDLFDLLKLRVGYGQTSNQAIAPYATLGRLATRPYNFGDSDYANGYFVNTLPNQNLGWEYSETWNYGVDYTMLDGRLSGTIEYYVTNTKDILLNVGLPSTSGVSSYTGNIGETQNKGVEFSVQGSIIQSTNGWSWDAGLNIYANRNKLVALASDQLRDEGNGWFVGYPINSIYDYVYEGIWQEDDPYLDILEPGGNVGMIKVEYTGEYDENGVPVREIGPDDRQVIDLQPNFQGGFNSRVGYKQFALDIVGAFQQGGILISTLHSGGGYLNMLSGRRGNVDVDYWTPENTDARYPLPGGLTSGDNPEYANTLANFDASYLKIRAMTLSYTVAQNNFMKNTGVRSLRLYATVQNPFVLFSPYNRETGLDPETNSYGNENQAVASYNRRILTVGTNTPTTRNYLFGINLSF